MRRLLTLTVVLVIALVIVALTINPAAAKVTGRCDNCHTMHNSQNGNVVVDGGPHESLLVGGCIGCHSSSNSDPVYSLGGCDVPVVYTTGSSPVRFLAGGNFYWVADGGGNNDAKGHNVLGISGVDESLSVAPGGFGCFDSNCHSSLAEKQNIIPGFGSGCQGCHLRPAHHANDSATVVGAKTSSTDGYYRFLSGHASANNRGVCGIEDKDWQATYNSHDHNEYLGSELNLNSSASMMSLGNTMTGFCCGCHGNFHREQDSSGNWIRHPSDAVIPNKGEYANAFGADGDSFGVYNPNVPVARPSLTDWEGPKSVVKIGTDMVMCLSCHVAHGSPYDDLLRWDYNQMIAGGGSSTAGCFACHTNKD